MASSSKKIPFKLLPQEDRTLQPETAATEARSKCLKKQRDALAGAVSQKLKWNLPHFCGFTGSLLSAHNTIAAPQWPPSLNQFSSHQQSKVQEKLTKRKSSKIFLIIIIIIVIIIIIYPMGAKAPSTQMCSAVLYLKLSSKNDPLFTKMQIRDIICKYTMALWIYSYMCKICIYVHIFAMMRLYVCCEHCATMVNWLSFLIWPGQNLCSHPHRFSCPMTVWPSSFDPPCEHQDQLMLSAPREAVPYACWSEYDQSDMQRS